MTNFENLKIYYRVFGLVVRFFVSGPLVLANVIHVRFNYSQIGIKKEFKKLTSTENILEIS